MATSLAQPVPRGCPRGRSEHNAGLRKGQTLPTVDLNQKLRAQKTAALVAVFVFVVAVASLVIEQEGLDVAVSPGHLTLRSLFLARCEGQELSTTPGCVRVMQCRLWT